MWIVVITFFINTFVLIFTGAYLDLFTDTSGELTGNIALCALGFGFFGTWISLMLATSDENPD